jgi:hypothetical protein
MQNSAQFQQKYRTPNFTAEDKTTNKQQLNSHLCKLFLASEQHGSET